MFRESATKPLLVLGTDPRSYVEHGGLKPKERRLPSRRIEIDGGIDRENIASVVAAGAEIIVAGTAIFGAADPEEAVRGLREATVQWV